MSRMIRITVFVLALTMSLSALAAASMFLSGGVTSQGGALRPYVYGELQMFDDLALGVDYHSAAITFSLWSGAARGMYAQGSWANVQLAKPDAAELGLWTNVSASPDYGMVAWAGLKAVKGDPKISLTLNAEIDVALSPTISALGGASLSVLGSNNSAYGWIGLGTRF